MQDIEAIHGALLDSQMKSSTLIEANDSTVPSGDYRLDIISKKMDSASEQSPWPGRLVIRMGAKVTVNKSGEPAKTIGTVFFDASPQEERGNNGTLDGPTRAWANLVRAAGVTKTAREVYDWIGNYPMSGYVSKAFKDPETGKWSSPKTPAEIQRFLDNGVEPKNFVQNLRTFKPAV